MGIPKSVGVTAIERAGKDLQPESRPEDREGAQGSVVKPCNQAWVCLR